MKLVVNLTLIVATASAISYPSKLLKRKMQRKRQAQARTGGNVAVTGVADGGSRSEPWKFLNYPDNDETHSYYPSWEFQRTGTWSTLDWCPSNTWAIGMGNWQDDNRADPKGVTNVEFFCEKYRQQTLSPNDPPKVISAGLKRGSAVPRGNCPQGKWIVGLRVISGNDSVGIVQLIPICQVPYDLDCAFNAPYFNEDLTIEAYDSRVHFFDGGWTETDLKCSSGKAVCGVAGIFNHPYRINNESGLATIKIGCCKAVDSADDRSPCSPTGG